VKRVEYLLKLVFALVLGVLALFAPSVFLKAILSIVALILLAMNMRNYKILFLILSIVLFIIPASFFSNYISNRSFWRWINSDNFFQSSNNGETLKPDTYIDAADNLIISGPGFRILFDETSDKIYIPHEIKQSRSGDTLSLSSNSVNKSAFIEVGTKSPYNSIRIEASGLSISGNLTVKDMNIQTLGLSSYVDLQATNFIVNCAGLDLGGELSVDNIEINATGVSWKGTVDAQKVKVQGIGMDINLLVKRAEDIVIQATALNGSLKYLDEWAGTRNMSIYVTHGNFTLIEPSDNEGSLELNISGMINVDRKKY